ncbi:ARL14 effector protein isoform X1 [Amia ocellicauda]|uniref:ARL14 effector protein isoform X1 n=1 Tax=Amia ocellicauda TaxID=2972642 RepID=UPI0034644288|nr:AL14E protein [Amia calva]
MPVSCAAVGCTNRFVKGSAIRFYRFPISKPQLAAQWVQNLGRKLFTPTSNTCLCSEHFLPDCFRDYSGRQFLREDAVPTIFGAPPHPEPDAPKIESRKTRGGINSKDQRKMRNMHYATLSEQEKAQERERAKLRQRSRRQKLKEAATGSYKGRTAKALKSLEFANPGRQTEFAPDTSRRDKRRQTKQSNTDRQTINTKSKVYDSDGLLISSGRDLCDCLDSECLGCFYPCPECNSRKCGVECRCDRKWLYEQVEVEGGEIIRNKHAG